jgi:hypothetical protein
MKWELMLRGIRKDDIENMDFIDVYELFMYLVYHRKNVAPQDIALGIAQAFSNNK